MKILKKHRKFRKSIRYSLLTLALFTMITLGFYVGRAAVTAYNNSLLVDAYHVTVDGELRYVIQDIRAFHRLFEDYKQQFFFNIQDKTNISTVTIVQDMEIQPVKVLPEALTTLERVAEDLARIDEEAWYYTVEPGDNLWTLANVKNLVPLSHIVRFNPTLDPDRIWPGDVILLKPADPYYDVEVSIINTMREPVPYYTEYIRDATLLATQRLVVSQGVEGEMDRTYDIKMLNGYESRVDIVKEVILVEPTTAVVRVGTKRTLSRTSSTNFGVTTGRFTSGFGFRIHPISGVRSNHTGIDIANRVGTPILAYAEGRIIAAGWQGAAGLAVTIDHGGGLVTKYGHLSRIDVSVGDRVSVGQRIGGMGSTGYSTGSHLHFEVILNGKHRNPFDYI